MAGVAWIGWIAANGPRDTTEIATASGGDAGGVELTEGSPGGAIPTSERAPTQVWSEVAQTEPAENDPVVHLDVSVVDNEGAPVAGASVLMGSPRPEDAPARVLGNWHVMAATPEDGKVTIPLSQAQLDGASLFLQDRQFVEVRGRAPGYAHSDVVYLLYEGAERLSAQVILPGPGYDFIGHIADSAGNGIPSAMVRIGGRKSWRKREDGTVVSPYAIMKRSKTDGSVRARLRAHGAVAALRGGFGLRELPGMGRGRRLPACRSGDLAPARQQPLGDRARPNGEPSAGAVIQVDRRYVEDFISIPDATSDAAGRYRVQGIDPGRRILRATHPSHPDWRAVASRDFQEAGDVSWDPKLGPLNDVELSLRDDDGNPLQDWILRLDSEDPGEGWTDYQYSDASGQIVIRDGPVGPVTAALAPTRWI